MSTADNTTTDATAVWHAVADADALRRATKMVVQVEGRDVLLVWNDDAPVAMDDTCIHRQRSLSEGVLLGGRIVCPGHQWAFDLKTGHCRARDRYQPVHTARVAGETVEVALATDEAGD